MPNSRHATDPDVVDAVIQDMRATTREQWIEELSKYPDWDPAWTNGKREEHSLTSRNGTGKAHSEDPGSPANARS